jgi:CRISPR/Cas system CMR-associated protein Cmr3 (group 5 of RAMP superfamily)
LNCIGDIAVKLKTPHIYAKDQCKMKPITLSIPDELLEKSIAYAKLNGTNLNDLVRELLRRHVDPSSMSPAEKLLKRSNQITISTKDRKWNRDEFYHRKLFS